MVVADGVKRLKITGRCGLLEPEGGRVVVVMMVAVVAMVVMMVMIIIIVIAIIVIIMVIIIVVMSDVPMQSTGDVSAAAPALH